MKDQYFRLFGTLLAFSYNKERKGIYVPWGHRVNSYKETIPVFEVQFEPLSEYLYTKWMWRCYGPFKRFIKTIVLS